MAQLFSPGGFRGLYMKMLLASCAVISVLLIACGNPSAETQNPSPRAAAPPKVNLVGLTSISGKNRALLDLELAASSRASARHEHVILSEHEKSGQLEVLEIDVKSATVRVNNAGLVTLLTLRDQTLPSGK